MTSVGRAPERRAVTAAGSWRVERWAGSAQAMHDLDWPDPVTPTVWLCEVDRPALVLGSTQRVADVDRDALASALEVVGDDVEIAIRRSGGGAVLLEPGNGVWIDLLIPRTDPSWSEDISRSFRWLGAAWVAALGDLGIESVAGHDGPLACGAYGRRVCFAALGAGEVTVAGAKAVGLSQRRTRAGARFQSVCYGAWHPGPLAALGVEPDELPPVATIDRPAPEIEQALLHRLP